MYVQSEPYELSSYSLTIRDAIIGASIQFKITILTILVISCETNVYTKNHNKHLSFKAKKTCGLH